MSSVAYAALWVFIFSVPWEKMLALPGLSIIARATGATALGLAVLSVVISGRLRRWHAFHVAAVLFWGWAALELFLSHFGDRLPYKFWTYGQLILVLWMIWELAPSEARIRGLLTAFMFGAYVAAFETFRVYRREAGALRRFSAGGLDGNDLAMVLALALPMAWYLGMTYRQPLLRWACRAYLPVGVLTVGLTGSRGGMLATTVALLVVPLSMTRLSPGRLMTATMMLAAAGVLAVAYVPQTLIERLATTGVEVEGGSFGGRGKLWKAGLQVFPENPVFGVGTGGYKSAITPKLGPAAQVAHNSYLSVLIEQGIVGFVLYMMMFVAAFRSILKLPILERRFALVLLATLSIAMLPLTWEDRRPAWFVLAALIGFSHVQIVARGEHLRQPSPGRTGPPFGRPRAARQPERLMARVRDDGGDPTE
jgi:O-antigen ligase